MIRKREKYWLHQYARWANLARPDYVGILASTTGKRSAADPEFTHEDFDRAMASLEAVLWQRIDEGLVADPGRLARYYWRNKAPRPGAINSRLKWRLNHLWILLTDYLPEAERNDIYLAGIIARTANIPAAALVSGGVVAWERVPASAARLAIEAIKDRLKYAVRGAAA